VCGSSARTDLYGGQLAIAVPTVTSSEPITKSLLMIDPPQRARSVNFSEQSVCVFGNTGISRGRLQLELEDCRIDQRFLRIFAKRDGTWQAVSVSVRDMSSLYLLASLLTGNDDKAERCFISALDAAIDVDLLLKA
jgi:hypothetical protein